MSQSNILLQTIPCIVYLFVVLINPSIFEPDSPGWILLVMLFALAVILFLIIKTLIEDSMFFFTGLVTSGFLYYNFSTVALILLDPQGIYILHSALMFASILLPLILYYFYLIGVQVVSFFKKEEEDIDDPAPVKQRFIGRMFFFLAAGAAFPAAIVFFLSGNSGPGEFIAVNGFFIYLYWFINFIPVFDDPEEDGLRLFWMVILFILSAAITGCGFSLAGQILLNSLSGGLIDAVIISGCAVMLSFVWYLMLVISGVLFLNNRHNDSGLISLIVNGGIISGGAFFLLHEGMISELIVSYKYYLLISLVLFFFIVASLFFAHTGGSLISKISKKFNRG